MGVRRAKVRGIIMHVCNDGILTNLNILRVKHYVIIDNYIIKLYLINVCDI